MDDNDAVLSIRAAIFGKGSDGLGDAAVDDLESGKPGRLRSIKESTAAWLSGADEPARVKKS